MIPHTWNANRQSLSHGQIRSQIFGGWQNYKRAADPWQPINASIRSDLSVTAFPGSVQFSDSSQGWADICIDGSFSVKRQIEEQNGDNAEPDFCMGMAVETQHNVSGHIDDGNPNQILYPGAWDAADLRVGIWHGRAARIEKVVDIHTMPAGDSEFVEYSFLMRSSHARVWTGENYDERPFADSNVAELIAADAFIARDDSTIRGTILRTPVAWYYESGDIVRVPVLVTFEIQPDGETVRATKFIPRALIAVALASGSRLYTDATFSPDASPETSTVDGRTVAANKSLSWTDMIAETANYVRDTAVSEELRVWAKNTTDNWDVIERIHLLFDTSSIGSDQSVDSASLDVSIDSVYFDDLGLSWNIYGTDPASDTSLATGDHDNVGTTPFSDSPRYLSSESTDWTTVSLDLNTDGESAIDLDGISKFGLATQEDRENDSWGDPTWTASDRSGFKVRLAENASNIPTLTVTHSGGDGGDGGDDSNGGGGGDDTLMDTHLAAIDFVQNILNRKQV